MKLTTNVFDLWVFTRDAHGTPRYLLLHTSQAKADKWFGGGRFWQVSGDFLQEDEATLDGIRRCLRDELHVEAQTIWATEHVYTIYNRRFDSLQVIPVFAAELAAPAEIPLTWEHSEAAWLTADECLERINFWGLRESLDKLRTHVTEHPSPPAEFRLA